MPWLQVHVDADQQGVATVEAVMEALGALSVTLEDAADQALLEPPPDATPIWRCTRVTGLFTADSDPDRLRDELTRRLGPDIHCDPLVETLADRPWEQQWLEHFRPLCFGDRLWVVPAGTQPPDPAAINLRMAPGLAFGTGTHPTTALCLEWLVTLPLTGRVVVDFGCGSGILAVAAALLGARHVHAIDHDPQALLATSANAEQNGVGGCIEIHGGPETAADPATGTADVVIANILANTLIDLAPYLGALVAPGGLLGLSGILPAQTSRVATAYTPCFEFDFPLVRDEWALLSGRRVQ